MVMKLFGLMEKTSTGGTHLIRASIISFWHQNIFKRCKKKGFLTLDVNWNASSYQNKY
jgi:hypothetical protein